jgi:hypothetical protein
MAYCVRLLIKTLSTTVSLLLGHEGLSFGRRIRDTIGNAKAVSGLRVLQTICALAK